MKGKRVTFTHKVFKANKRDFDTVELVKEFYPPENPKGMSVEHQISYYRGHYGMKGIESIEEIEDET
jgi:hypothetical protein